MNNTLYTITNKFVDLMNKAQEEELTEQEYNELGQELATELTNKSANIIGYIQNTESFINAIKDEETRLESMRRAAEIKLDKFKQYVKENMEKLELKEIPTELGKLTIVKNPTSVEIENEDEIPAEFKNIIQTIKPDKTAIKKHFKETGEVVSGVRIVDDKTSLRIK